MTPNSKHNGAVPGGPARLGALRRRCNTGCEGSGGRLVAARAWAGLPPDLAPATKLRSGCRAGFLRVHDFLFNMHEF